jgi:hypothetical protein
MSSFVYNACLYNVFRSMIHFDTDMFKMMLVSSSYDPDMNHEKRSDVRGEISSGGGYIQGGLEVGVSVKKDRQNSRVDIVLGEAVWSNSSITASGAIVYKVGTGGARTDDLVCFVGFAKEVSSTDANFRITESTLRIQN